LYRLPLPQGHGSLRDLGGVIVPFVLASVIVVEAPR
jgi:hypothetical protein